MEKEKRKRTLDNYFTKDNKTTKEKDRNIEKEDQEEENEKEELMSDKEDRTDKEEKEEAVGSEKYLLVNEDSKKWLTARESLSVQLIVSSPPYNIGKEYETKADLDKYLSDMKEFIKEFYRVLKLSGSICWQVGNFVNKGEVIPLDILFYPLFVEAGFTLRNRVIWHFGHGLHCTKRFSGRYETVLWFTKSEDYTFNLDDVRIPSKYPGKTHYKGKKKGKPSGNPLGKNPSDVWETVKEDWESSFWDIPNVKSNHPEKSDHPCQFPVELVERCVLAFSKENDIVVDPFCGVGSTIIASVKHQRFGIGIDTSTDYLEKAKNRLELLENGELKTREIGTPIHKPKETDKVAKTPSQWKKQKTN